MNFGFLKDQDATRFSYLRLRRLKGAIKDPKVLDAVSRALEVPGDEARSPGKKLAAIERRIEELRGTEGSLWHGVPAPEVLAASIYKARPFADEAVGELFTSVPGGEGLARPVLIWLRNAGLAAIRNVPFTTGPVDFVGYRKTMLSGSRVVAIQARNDAAQIESALDGMEALAPYTNATYLACTPAVAAEYLAACAARPAVARWDADALRRKLAVSGAGLLVIERDAVSQAIFPKERGLDVKKLQEFFATLPD